MTVPNLMTEFGFCQATDPAEQQRYANLWSAVEGNFSDPDRLRLLRRKVEQATLNPADQRALLDRIDYYEWDLGRQEREEDKVPVTWGLEPADGEPGQKGRVAVKPYIRRGRLVSGYVREEETVALAEHLLKEISTLGDGEKTGDLGFGVKVENWGRAPDSEDHFERNVYSVISKPYNHMARGEEEAAKKAAAEIQRLDTVKEMAKRYKGREVWQAQDMTELEGILTGRYPQMEFHLEGADFRCTHAAVSEWDNLVSANPVLKKGARGIKLSAPGQKGIDPNMWAASNMGLIVLNAEWWTPDRVQEMARTMDDAEASGFHPPGCNTFESQMAHELGHVLDWSLMSTRKTMPRWSKLRRELAAMPEEDKPSKYATFNEKEAVAEGFAELTNGESWSPLTARLSRYLQEEL